MPLAGLEPATLWLEAIRAIRLRHKGRIIFFNKIFIFVVLIFSIFEFFEDKLE